MRICQLENLNFFILFLFLFSGCSQNQIALEFSDQKINPFWLQLRKEHAFKNENDEALIHPFFDVDNEFKMNSEIQYFVMTPFDSKAEYQLNMLSGSLIKIRDFCETEDIWQNYKGDISKPNFIVGGLPRYLDKDGNIGKIFIFTSDKDQVKFEHQITKSYTARVVGSLIIESCEDFICYNNKAWKKNQILIGVDPKDQKYGKVEDFFELRKMIDWNYAKAFILNSFGSINVGPKFFPAYRINKELNLTDTDNKFNQYYSQIDIKDYLQKRESCADFFDSLWDDIKKINKFSSDKGDAFLKFYRNFHLKNDEQYFKCLKIVRPANINLDYEKHWFFEFLTAFQLLERHGLYYNCAEQVWYYNTKKQDGTYNADQDEILKTCKPMQFEKSFEYGINAMSMFKSQLNKSFRYVEYDSETNGSHQKIYSWITEDSRKIRCEKEKPNREYFPQDVVWKYFSETNASK